MRLLIVRLSSMGDIIHALPLAENACRSGAEVGWLTDRAYAGLLEGNPSVTRLFLADTRLWRRRPLAARAWGRLFELRRELAGFAPQATIDVQGLWKSAALARLAGAPLIGFDRRTRREPSSSVLIQKQIRVDPSAAHVVDQNLSLLGPTGILVERRHPDARYLLDRPSPAAQDFLARVRRPFALYHPGSARPEKAWGEENYAALARQLADRGLFPVISWGPGDEPRAGRLSALLPEAVLIPPLDFAGLARVAAACALIIGGDTGPVHLADAVGAPALALFGSRAEHRNVPQRNRPYRGAALSYDQTASVESVARKAAEIAETGKDR